MLVRQAGTFGLLRLLHHLRLVGGEGVGGIADVDSQTDGV